MMITIVEIGCLARGRRISHGVSKIRGRIHGWGRGTFG